MTASLPSIDLEIQRPGALRPPAPTGAGAGADAVAALHRLLGLERSPGAAGRWQAYVDELERLAQVLRTSPTSPLLDALHGEVRAHLSHFLSGPDAADRAGFVAERALDPTEVARWFDALADNARKRATETADRDGLRFNMLSFIAYQVIWRYKDALRARRRRDLQPMPPQPSICSASTPAATLLARLTIERLLETTTPRERRILELLYEEYNQTEIARRTGISRREVGRCLQGLRRRLRDRTPRGG